MQARKLIRVIDAARERRGIKHTEMAKLTETTSNNWYSVRNGQHFPSLWLTIRYANAVGLRLALMPAEEGKRDE